MDDPSKAGGERRRYAVSDAKRPDPWADIVDVSRKPDPDRPPRTATPYRSAREISAQTGEFAPARSGKYIISDPTPGETRAVAPARFFGS